MYKKGGKKRVKAEVREKGGKGDNKKEVCECLQWVWARPPCWA